MNFYPTTTENVVGTDRRAVRIQSAERRAQRSRPTTAFTLIELLAVITIMLIVIAVALPGLKAIQATGLQTAVRQVTSEMKLARQYAITQHATVRFAVCVGNNSLPDLGSNHVCRAYSILVATNDANNTLVGWVPIQDWKFLPDGIVFSEHCVGNNAYNPLTLNPLPPLGAFTNRVLGTSAVSDSWRYFDSTNSLTVYLPGGSTPTWLVSFVEFGSTGYAANVPANGGGIRVMLGTLSDPANRTVSVTDTSNWAYIEYDSFGRVRTRYRDTYQ